MSAPSPRPRSSTPGASAAPHTLSLEKDCLRALSAAYSELLPLLVQILRAAHRSDAPGAVSAETRASSIKEALTELASRLEVLDRICDDTHNVLETSKQYYIATHPQPRAQRDAGEGTR